MRRFLTLLFWSKLSQFSMRVYLAWRSALLGHDKDWLVTFQDTVLILAMLHGNAVLFWPYMLLGHQTTTPKQVCEGRGTKCDFPSWWQRYHRLGRQHYKVAMNADCPIRCSSWYDIKCMLALRHSNIYAYCLKSWIISRIQIWHYLFIGSKDSWKPNQTGLITMEL